MAQDRFPPSRQPPRPPHAATVAQPFGAKPPHPATVAQPFGARSPHAATVAQPFGARSPHTATVAQPFGSRPPHAATVARPAGARALHPATAVQRAQEQVQVQSSQERLVQEMEALKKLSKLQWDGAGAKDFAEWMGREENDGMVPEDANCWNALLYAAHKAGLVDKAYIRKANVGGRDGDLGPAIARAIADNPRGAVRKNFTIASEDQRQNNFVSRVAEIANDIPRGDTIVLHRRGFHVCLSLGGGKVLELDKQALVPVDNPNYNKNYGRESLKFSNKIDQLKQKAKKGDEKAQADLEKWEADWADWKTKNSNKDKVWERQENEIREVDLMKLPYLDPKSFVNMDGVYWGPLPSPLAVKTAAEGT